MADMTAEEEKDMGKKLAQAQKPDIGSMIADKIREETAKQNAQREARGGMQQDNSGQNYPNQDYHTNEKWKKDWLENRRKVRCAPGLPPNTTGYGS